VRAKVAQWADALLRCLLPVCLHAQPVRDGSCCGVWRGASAAEAGQERRADETGAGGWEIVTGGIEHENDVAEVYRGVQMMPAKEEILNALKMQHEAIDTLMAMLILRDKDFFPSRSGIPFDGLIAGNEMIKRLEAFSKVRS
jgi:hypothetical protein